MKGTKDEEEKSHHCTQKKRGRGGVGGVKDGVGWGIGVIIFRSPYRR